MAEVRAFVTIYKQWGYSLNDVGKFYKCLIHIHLWKVQYNILAVEKELLLHIFVMVTSIENKIPGVKN